jgi:hypothetical protein
MDYFKSFAEHILQFSSENFEETALHLFEIQAKANPIYRKYLEARRIIPANIHRIEDIPFLPIRFFKDHEIASGPINEMEGFYASSGTTGMITSRHYYWSESFYLRHTLNLFEKEYGSIKDYHILALLPAYLERQDSSLVSMASHFIQSSESIHSGFYLYNHKELIEKLQLLKDEPRKILLLGVTFALLDLAEGELDFPELTNLIVMETGGMKGRRKEMVREDVHRILKERFRVPQIHSEYGMTEMMSQAYSKGEGIYTMPSTMRVIIRDVNDPLSLSPRQTGGLNIIDLANFHSCAFLETQDLGKRVDENRIEVLGRFDNSDVRGCNLMVN